MFKDIIYAVSTEGVASVRINRAAKHNCFDDTVIAELEDAFKQAAEDPQVRVLVLAAEGENFSAGADLGWMQRMVEYSYEDNLRDAEGLAS